VGDGATSISVLHRYLDDLATERAGRYARRRPRRRAVRRHPAARRLAVRLAAVPTAEELEAEGLVTRTVVPATPVQSRHARSGRGRDLIVALQPLVKWGNAATHWVHAQPLPHPGPPGPKDRGLHPQLRRWAGITLCVSRPL